MSALCKIHLLDSSDVAFDADLAQLTAWDEQENREVERVVDEVLQGVKTRGDDALLEYTNRFDRRDCQSVEQLMVPAKELQRALDELDAA